MRPPEHWHLRRRRRLDPSWLPRLLVAFVVLVGGVLFWRLVFAGNGASGGASDSSVASSVCPQGAACAPDATEEAGAAVPTATPACPIGSDCAPTATPPCPDGGAACLPPVGPAFGGDGALPSGDYVVASDAPAPSITGGAAAVIEQSCGALLYGLNAHDRLPPASLTKIATALVAAEHAEQSEIVDVKVNSELLKASTNSSVMGLMPGQRISMRDLLHGLLMASGNDAAIAIADHVSGAVPPFVSLMNTELRELGLQNTYFVNPHGLDEDGSYTSAYDIAILGRELLAEPELAAIVSKKTYQPAWDGPQIWNGNQLLYDYPGAIGVKTGTTPKAGQTFVAAARRDGRAIVVSVLRGWDRYGDAVLLLDWAFNNTTSPCY